MRDNVAGYDEMNEAICRLMGQLEGRDGATKWPGMTYEQGIRDALDWAMDMQDDDPLDELDN